MDFKDYQVNIKTEPGNFRPGQVPFSVDDAAKLFASEMPDIWKAVYTKHIETPGTHYGYKAAAVALASSIVMTSGIRSRRVATGSEVSSACTNVAACAGVMQQYNYPIYYVSQSVLNAMLHTHPPTEMTWDKLFLPFDGMMFMLPRNSFFEPATEGGGEVVLVGVAKIGGDIKVPGVNTGIKCSWAKGSRITVFWVLSDFQTLSDCTFPSDQLLEPDPTWIDAKMKDVPRPMDGRIDSKYSSWVAGLVANLILVMQARKELVEPGSATGKRLGSGVPVHRPTFIGRNYAVIQRNRAESTGAHFTELDWRAGHYRRQHFGPGGKEEKLVLIDPYIAFTRGLVKGA